VDVKTLIKARKELEQAGRWDIDFHLPAEGVREFPPGLLKRIDEAASIARDKRDPTKQPESIFQYIDISAIDVTIGEIINPQDVEGSEAPSRARKVVRAFDILVSTCRPTRGAIAVVPESLHNQIASTGFSVVRPFAETNPFYLHYALRLPSTLEQFRKWSTGSSYPAILDQDVAKTLIPMPAPSVQDAIAEKIVTALKERSSAIRGINRVWTHTLAGITASLCGHEAVKSPEELQDEETRVLSIADIQRRIADLPALISDSNGNGQAELKFMEELEVLTSAASRR
jgi:hypothetical protein